jgi:hypothetical protein
LAQSRARVSAPVEALVTLRNQDDQPVLVNRRMLFSTPRNLEREREVTFDIEGPPGYVNTRVVHVHARRPADEHFVLLQPGESVERMYNLAEYNSMHEPGFYVIRASYTNVHHPTRGRAWTGSIESESVQLECIAGAGRTEI